MGLPQGIPQSFAIIPSQMTRLTGDRVDRNSAKNQNILGPYLSSNTVERFLVGETDSIDGTARAFWRQGVFRFCEISFVIAQEDDLACTGARKGEGYLATDSTLLSMVLVGVFL